MNPTHNTQRSLTFYTELDRAHNTHGVSVYNVPLHAGMFVTSCGTIMFSRTTLLHAVSYCIDLLETGDSESPLAKDYSPST